VPQAPPVIAAPPAPASPPPAAPRPEVQQAPAPAPAALPPAAELLPRPGAVTGSAQPPPPAPGTQAVPGGPPGSAVGQGRAPATTPPLFDADYLHNPKPRYPAAAARLRESGRVLLTVAVSAAGVPDRVEIATSSGSPRLDQAALDTVRRWRFVPARQGDQPVAATVTVPLVFRLDE
jgi:protein TonB